MLSWMTQWDTLSLVEENIYMVWKVILDHWFTTATESALPVWYCASLTHYLICDLKLLIVVYLHTLFMFSLKL